MTFNNLKITTPNSTLKGQLRFDYKREDFQYFTDRVSVTASFKDSELLLDELNAFYNEFGSNQLAKFDVELYGTLNDLLASNLKLKTNRKTTIAGDVNFKNIFSKEDNNFSMRGRFSNVSSNYYDLIALLPNILDESIPSVFSRLGHFKIRGNTFVTSSNIDADLDVNTALGFISTNLKMTHVQDIDNANYQGNIVFNTFDLGQLLEDPKFKTTSFNLNVDGTGFTLENLNTKVDGHIFSLNYNNYDYQNINVSGQLGSKIYNGLLESHDPNLKLKFNGLADLSQGIKKLDFKANVKYANLKALNFIEKDSTSVFKGHVEMSMKGSGIEDAFGNLSFTNTTYSNDAGNYYFEDFDVVSDFKNKKRFVSVNSPDIIEGSLNGEFKFKDLGRLIENSLGSLYTNYVPNKTTTHQYVDFDFKINHKIAEVFYSDLKLGKNTYIKGRIESDAKGFDLTFRSPEIELKDYFAKNVHVKIDNNNPLFNTHIQIDSLGSKFYNISKFDLINVTLRDTLFVKSEFKGGPKNNDKFNLNMFYTIDENNKSVAGFRKSNIKFKDNNWYINKNKNKLNKVVFDRDFKNVDIKNIWLNHLDEELELSGQIINSTEKHIELDFRGVDLGHITPNVDSLKLEGVINGKLKLLQQSSSYFPSSNLVINDFTANGLNLGELKVNVFGNKSLTNYNVDIHLENDNVRTFDTKGVVNVSEEHSNIDLDVYFNEFLLQPLNPLGEGIITDIRGEVSGAAKVSGRLDNPQINGNLSLDNAGIKIPYLNVDYSFDFDSKVKLEGQKFIFDDVELTDSQYFSKATINGFIEHHNFSDWILGLDLETDRLLVLNTEDSEESLYYGTAFMDGTASIKGPTDQLLIEVDGQTGKGTVFKVPLNDFETYGDNSYIHFLSPEEKRAQLQGETIADTQIKGLELEFNLIVNPLAEIEIVIDRKSGNTIQGSGNGNLLFQINTNGKFKMWGDFSVTRGTYNFSYGGLIQKEFEVEPGGKIEWEGDPMDAQLNLKAIYETEANPSVLLDNPINRTIPVDVEINLTGQLEQPEPIFTFSFPNVNSTIRSELDYRLESKESRENQALYLLATGSFSSDVSFGQQAYGTIADRVNNFVNSLITSENDKLQLGVDYQVGEQTPEYQTDNRLGVTLKTQISDRVIINGKVGVPIGGVNETVIAGNVQVDVLLNEEGTLTAKIFNRENRIRNFGEDIGYTQGLGLSYNVEFDTFKELLNIIFKGKNKEIKEDKTQKAKPTANASNPNLPDYINMKQKFDEDNK